MMEIIEKISPLHTCKRKRTKHINLLLILSSMKQLLFDDLAHKHKENFSEELRLMKIPDILRIISHFKD